MSENCTCATDGRCWEHSHWVFEIGDWVDHPIEGRGRVLRTLPADPEPLHLVVFQSRRMVWWHPSQLEPVID
jgi:hypothetical protein